MNKLVGVAVVCLLSAPALARPQPDATKTYAVPVDGYPSEGPADAKVTLVIAHDYADPYSEKNLSTLADLRQKYGKDLRIVFRNMVVHPRNAMAGALASCAAHKQGKFAALEPTLWDAFRSRNLDLSDVDTGNNTTDKCWNTKRGCPIVIGLAGTTGMDVRRFREDMKTCEAEVAADMRELRDSFAIAATPSFFINGRFLMGAQPAENFERIIDPELARATAAIKKGTKRDRYYRDVILGTGEAKVDMTATPSQGQMPTPRPPRTGPDPAKTYAVKVDGYPSRGPAEARITIVMFFDYATPYAVKALPTLDELATQYGSDLRFVYRTRLVHPRNAKAAALAMCAANKLKKFPAMDAALWKAFEARQLDTSELPTGEKCWDSAAGCPIALGIARRVGLDRNKMKAEMKACVATVDADDADATKLGINATPTFYINGRVLSGAVPASYFTPIIDEELAKSQQRGPTPDYYQKYVIGAGQDAL